MGQLGLVQDARQAVANNFSEQVRAAVWDNRRLSVLHGLEALDSAADADFDRLTGLAAALLATPVAAITLVDSRRQWFQSSIGVEAKEMPLDISFSAHAIAVGADVMVIPDASIDPRFADNPMVTGADNLRFYAGVPIIVAGVAIGTLCVLDRKPRPVPPPEKLDQLKALAALAASLFALKTSTRAGALAKAALAREEKRRALALEAAELASWVWDPRSGIVECDLLLPELFGLPTTTRLRARDIVVAIDRRDINKNEVLFRDALSSSDEYSGEYRVKGFDPPRWLSARGRVVERDAQGRPTLVFGVNYDITERKAGEARQRLLLRELNHRVKNTLATVQALATQTVRHAREPREFLEAFRVRLRALGVAHSLLSDHEWRGIGIRELVRLELQPFDDAERPRVSVHGQEVFLSPDQTLGLSLILHELASNALKYGALSAAEGTVSVNWAVHGEKGARRLLFNWVERGGPKVEPPSHHGFGSILIRRSLAKVLSSEVRHEFPPEGVFAEISMPLDDAG